MAERNAQGNLAAYEQRIRERLVVDETSPSGLRWGGNAFHRVRGKPAGTMCSNGYWQVGLVAEGKMRMFKAHRICWLLTAGNWPKEQIDHVNGDRSDNRISNLREASRVENACNRAIRRDNSSSVKGVRFDMMRRKWVASIVLAGKKIQIGRFTSIADAEQAIRSARDQYHGKFANHGRSMTC